MTEKEIALTKEEIKVAIKIFYEVWDKRPLDNEEALLFSKLLKK
jgi:hypothetical protein